MKKSETLMLVLLLSLAARTPAQESGKCPMYQTAMLFTPIVMLDIINVGEMYLALTIGSSEEVGHSCQTLTFHDGKTYTYSYHDASDETQTITGSYQAGFPTFITTSAHIKLRGGTPNVLAADILGTSKLIPVAYAFGIVLFVSCTNFLWFHKQQFFLFLDGDIDLGPFDYAKLAQVLSEVGIIPEDLQLDIPDQSCRRAKTSKNRYMKLT